MKIETIKNIEHQILVDASNNCDPDKSHWRLKNGVLLNRNLAQEVLSLQSQHLKLREAFEELLSSAADRKHTWSIDGTHLERRNDFKFKWRKRAGLT